MKRKLEWRGMLCAVLATAVCMSAAFAGGGKDKKAGEAVSFHETGLPIVDKTVTLNFVGMNMNNTRAGRYDETDMMKELEKETNVHIVWDAIPQTSWKEKKNLLIAGGQLPDGFMGPLSLTAEEIQTLGADGVLIPLDSLIDKYAPNLKKLMAENPTYDPFCRSLDGKIYAVTAMQDQGFDSMSGAVIRKEWLDKLGLAMPQTTEEFYQVLKAFKDKDAAGNGKTIPFSFLYQESPSVNREVKREFEWIFLAFGVMENPKHIAVEDNGEVVFTADKEGFKDAIKYLHRLFAEGLIDPEIFSQDRTLLTNKIRQLNVGCYTDYRLKSSMASEEIQDKFALLPPLKGPSGNQRWLRAISGMNEGAFAITKNCKYPEVAVRWLDTINKPENNIQMAYGMFKPAGWNASDALVPSVKQPGKWDGNVNLRPKTVAPNDWPWSAPVGSSPVVTTKSVIDTYLADRQVTVYKKETCAVYRPYLTKYPYNYPFRFTVDEIEQLDLLQTDLLNYIYKKEALWISKGGIDEEWDQYLAELKKMKVDQYLNFYKTSYVRSLKK